MMAKGKYKPWFEMLDGTPRFLGYFRTFEEADAKACASATWLFDEKDLKKFVKVAKQELDRARDSS